MKFKKCLSFGMAVVVAFSLVNFPVSKVFGASVTVSDNNTDTLVAAFTTANTTGDVVTISGTYTDVPQITVKAGVEVIGNDATITFKELTTKNSGLIPQGNNVIKGLKLVAPPTNSTTTGVNLITISNKSNVIIENNTFVLNNNHNSASGTGHAIIGGGQSGVLIENNEFTVANGATARDAIYIDKPNVVIDNNMFTGNYRNSTVAIDGTSNASGADVKNNIFSSTVSGTDNYVVLNFKKFNSAVTTNQGGKANGNTFTYMKATVIPIGLFQTNGIDVSGNKFVGDFVDKSVFKLGYVAAIRQYNDSSTPVPTDLTATQSAQTDLEFKMISEHGYAGKVYHFAPTGVSKTAMKISVASENNATITNKTAKFDLYKGIPSATNTVPIKADQTIYTNLTLAGLDWLDGIEYYIVQKTPTTDKSFSFSPLPVKVDVTNVTQDRNATLIVTETPPDATLVQKKLKTVTLKFVDKDLTEQTPGTNYKVEFLDDGGKVWGTEIKGTVGTNDINLIDAKYRVTWFGADGTTIISTKDITVSDSPATDEYTITETAVPISVGLYEIGDIDVSKGKTFKVFKDDIEDVTITSNPFSLKSDTYKIKWLDGQTELFLLSNVFTVDNVDTINTKTKFYLVPEVTPELLNETGSLVLGATYQIVTSSSALTVSGINQAPVRLAPDTYTIEWLDANGVVIELSVTPDKIIVTENLAKVTHTSSVKNAPIPTTPVTPSTTAPSTTAPSTTQPSTTAPSATEPTTTEPTTTAPTTPTQPIQIITAPPVAQAPTQAPVETYSPSRTSRPRAEAIVTAAPRTATPVTAAPSVTAQPQTTPRVTDNLTTIEEDLALGNVDVPEYTDIKTAEWAKNAIDYLTKKGIISGTGDGKVEPNRAITRAEFAKVVVKAFNLKLKGTAKTFKDMNSKEWYAEFIDIMTSNAIISGYDDDTIKGNQIITREQMATIIYNIMQKQGYDFKDIRIEGVTDEKDSSDYAKDSIDKLYKKGVIEGQGNGVFAPKKSATRAEAFEIIYKMLEKIETTK